MSTRKDPIYHDFIDFYRNKIIPTHSLAEGHVAYDIKVNASCYQRNMLFMNAEVASFGLPTCNVFPMRSGIIPGHFRLDTTSLHRLLYQKSDHLKGEDNRIKGAGYIDANKQRLWG